MVQAPALIAKTSLGLAEAVEAALLALGQAHGLDPGQHGLPTASFRFAAAGFSLAGAAAFLALCDVGSFIVFIVSLPFTGEMTR